MVVVMMIMRVVGMMMAMKDDDNEGDGIEITYDGRDIMYMEIIIVVIVMTASQCVT